MAKYTTSHSEQADRDLPLSVIQRLEDIPDFASEAEEADYWGAHTLSWGLLQQMRRLTGEEAPRVQRTKRG